MQNFYSPYLHNSDEAQNILQFRATIPYQIGTVNNIARLTLPYERNFYNDRVGPEDTVGLTFKILLPR